MNKLTIALSFALSLGLVSTQVSAQDDTLAQGKKLHNDKCTSCHGTEVYTREDRRIHSRQALAQQVNTCMKGPADADWTPAQTDAVIEYLSTRFYKF